jgi:PKD repeat protein
VHEAPLPSARETIRASAGKILVILAAIALLPAEFATVAEAENWDIEVTISPFRTKALRDVEFTLTLENLGDVPVTVCQIDIEYDWDAETQNVFTGNRDIAAGGSELWTTTEAIPDLPPATYDAVVTVTAVAFPLLCSASSPSDWTVSIEIVANLPPTAAFSYAPLQATTRTEIQFADESSDSDGSVGQWRWDFGDGTNSTERNPRHQFHSPSVYQVVLTVTDDDGSADSVTQNVVIVANLPPTAAFSYSPETPAPMDVVNFRDDSTDSDGTIEEWRWDFSDGNVSSAQHPTHAFATGRIYVVELVVTDNNGSTDSVSQPVHVAPNIAPRANFSYTPFSATTSTEIHFTDQSQDLDGSVVQRRWDFGDGNSSTEPNPVHRFRAPGVYQVTLTVTDDDGFATSVTQNVVIAAAAGANEARASGFGLLEWGAIGAILASISVFAVLLAWRRARPSRRWGQAGNSQKSAKEPRWRPK